MADILIDTQTAPATPASGKAVIFVDSTTKRLAVLNDAGVIGGMLTGNDSTASQSPAAATDTYITNSGILIPSFGMKVGQLYRWYLGVNKTAAGTAAAAFTVRIGSNQSTADTSRLVLTQTIAQAATACGGIILVTASVQVVSASGVIAGAWGPETGSLAFGSGVAAASSTFDNTAQAGLYVGLSVNTGASAAWTIISCVADLIG